MGPRKTNSPRLAPLIPVSSRTLFLCPIQILRSIQILCPFQVLILVLSTGCSSWSHLGRGPSSPRSPAAAELLAGNAALDAGLLDRARTHYERALALADAPVPPTNWETAIASRSRSWGADLLQPNTSSTEGRQPPSRRPATAGHRGPEAPPESSLDGFLWRSMHDRSNAEPAALRSSSTDFPRRPAEPADPVEPADPESGPQRFDASAPNQAAPLAGPLVGASPKAVANAPEQLGDVHDAASTRLEALEPGNTNAHDSSEPESERRPGPAWLGPAHLTSPGTKGADQWSDLDVEVQALNQLGLLSESRGDLEDAEDLYRRALRLQQANEPGTGEIAPLLNLASVYHALGGRHAVAAGDCAARVLELAEPAEDWLAMGHAHFVLGQVLRVAPSHSQSHLARACALLGREDPRGAARAHRALGTSLLESGDARRCLVDLSQARVLFARAQHLAGELSCWILLGEAYQSMGQPENAAVFWAMTRERAEAQAPPHLRAATLRWILAVWQISSHTSEARDALDRELSELDSAISATVDEGST